ncbi:MAG: hypothetical protein A2286_02685 [Gammaproteobacteria bacterium RIFOXYA12_FULL_61_12]|nr:MAG: hypothetical protein A2286_02685 [Gammaproteobacteria bacterium RIFOXYA12_FULL_61_12]
MDSAADGERARLRHGKDRSVILVITHTERNSRTGRKEIVASHGIDPDTGMMAILPSEPPEKLGAVFDLEIGEFVIWDTPSRGGGRA